MFRLFFNCKLSTTDTKQRIITKRLSVQELFSPTELQADYKLTEVHISLAVQMLRHLDSYTPLRRFSEVVDAPL